MSEPRIMVFSRPGCHLCEVAEGQVAAIAVEAGVTWAVRDVSGDVDLEDEYGDRVPVILVDGQEHAYFRVDRDRLIAALAGRRVY